MSKCQHDLVKWVPWKDGRYRLYCDRCWVYLGQETMMPMTLDPFRIKTITLDPSCQVTSQGWDYE